MTPSSILLAAVLLSSLATAQTYSATSAGELQLGVDAYKLSHYEQAVQHFEKAVDLDSSNLKARLYLATALVSQFIPGVDTEGNNHLAEEAIEQYQHVLDAEFGTDGTNQQRKRHRLPVPQHEKVRRVEVVLPDGFRPRPERPRALLFRRRDRLDGVLPAAPGRTRQARYEA